MPVPGATNGIPLPPLDSEGFDSQLSEAEKAAEQRRKEQRKALEAAQKAKAARDSAILDQQKAQLKQNQAEAQLDSSVPAEGATWSQDVLQHREPVAQQAEGVAQGIAGALGAGSDFIQSGLETVADTAKSAATGAITSLQAAELAKTETAATAEQAYEEGVSDAARGARSIEAEQLLATDQTTPAGLEGEGLLQRAEGQIDAVRTEAEVQAKQAERDEAAAGITGEQAAAFDTALLTRAEAEKQHENLRDKYREEVKADIEPPKPSILNLIGVALGGFLSVRTGGPNVAAELLNKRLSRDTETALANRRLKLQAMGEDLSESKETMSRATADFKLQQQMFDKKKEGVVQYLDAQIAKGAYQGRAKSIAEQISGQYKIDLAKSANGYAQQKFDEDLAQAKLNAAAQKKRGGGGGKRAASGLETFGDAVYFDATQNQLVDARTMDAKERKEFEDGLAMIPLTSPAGKTVRGVRLPNNKAGERVQNAYVKRGEVRDNVQRVLNRIRAAKESGSLGTLSLGGAFTGKAGAEMKSEWTNLMVALKNDWELGAIQKPDEKLMDDAMGLNPSGAWGFAADKMNLNQVESVLESMQSGRGLKMKSSILREAQLPEGFEINMPAFDVTADYQERDKEQAPLEGREVVQKAAGYIDNNDPERAMEEVRRLTSRAEAGAKGQGGGKRVNVKADDIAQIPALYARADSELKESIFDELISNPTALRAALPGKSKLIDDLSTEQRRKKPAPMSMGDVYQGIIAPPEESVEQVRARVEKAKKEVKKELLRVGKSRAESNKNQEKAAEQSYKEEQRVKEKGERWAGKVRGVVEPLMEQKKAFDEGKAEAEKKKAKKEKIRQAKELAERKRKAKKAGAKSVK